MKGGKPVKKLKFWLVKLGLISIEDYIDQELPKRDATGRFIIPKKTVAKKKVVAKKKAPVKKKAPIKKRTSKAKK